MQRLSRAEASWHVVCHRADMRQLMYASILALLLATWIIGCSPDAVSPSGSTGMSRLIIRLTDNPGDYQQVNIEVQQMRARLVDSSGTQWYDLATNAGVYDLLQLQNGLDTTLVNDSLPAGDLEELRLALGSNNTVMVDSVLRDLKVPSGSSSGLKIKLQQVLVQDSVSAITLDFDAHESIVARGNGGYNLRPVIRVLP